MAESIEEVGTPTSKAKKAEKQAPTGLAPVSEHKAALPKTKRFLHAAASALHGWHEFQHHNGEELKLTPEDYQKALDAAAYRDPERGRYVPHAPALSPSKFERVALATKERETAAKSAEFEATKREQLKKARLEARQKAMAQTNKGRAS